MKRLVSFMSCWISLLPMILTLFFCRSARCDYTFSTIWSARISLPTMVGNIGGCSSVAVDKQSLIAVGEEGSFWLVRKYDRAGNVSWTTTQEGVGTAYGVCIDTDESIVVAGETQDSQLHKFWRVSKYRADGSLMWSVTDQGCAHAIALDSDSVAVAVGQAPDWTVRKYGSVGNVLWSVTSSGTAHGVSIDASGNIVVIGFDAGWVVRKYDTQGQLLWSVTDTGYGSGVAFSREGWLVAVGYATVSGQERNWRVQKYDASGNVEWTRSYNGQAACSDEAYAVVIDPNDRIIVGGYEALGLYSYQMLVQAYCPNGTLLWRFDYHYHAMPSSMDGADSLAIDESGGLIVGGSGSYIDSSYGFVRAYGYPSTACPQDSTSTAQKMENGSVKIVGGLRGYVDPKRGEQATIQVRPASPGKVRVRICNQAGRLIADLAGETSSDGTIIHWDGKDSTGIEVSPGIYAVYVKAPGIDTVEKIVILK